MDYNSLIHCIPREMLSAVRDKEYEMFKDSSICVTINKKSIPLEKLTCKDVYWDYIREISDIPKAEKKWEKYLNLNDFVWQEYYYIPYIVCRETHIQSLQYKIFNRFFPCRYTLSIWYENESPYCNCCNESIDLLEHYFYYCPDVYLFWKSLMTWWSKTFDINIPIDVTSVLFGIPNFGNDKVLYFMNFCLIYAKWYIYCSKKKEAK